MNIHKHPSWSQVTLTEEKPDQGIDFSLTPQEKDIAVLAMTDIIANRMRVNNDDVRRDLLAKIRKGESA